MQYFTWDPAKAKTNRPVRQLESACPQLSFRGAEGDEESPATGGRCFASLSMTSQEMKGKAGLSNRSNIKKHGVSFRTAVQAFADPLAVREFDRIVAGEERWHTIGNIDGNLLLLVVQAGMTETMNTLELAALSPFATPRRVV